MSRRRGHSPSDLSPVTLHQRISEQSELRVRIEQRWEMAEKRMQKWLWVGDGNGTQEMRRQVALFSHPLDPVSSHRYTSSFPVTLCSDHLYSIFPPGNVKESIS